MSRPLAMALGIALTWTSAALAQEARPARTVAALERLRVAADGLPDARLRAETLAALEDRPCVRHRTDLKRADENAILAALRAQALMPTPADAAEAERQRLTVFPPVDQSGAPCPRLPQSLAAAPGGNAGSHHDWPGGLAEHEAFNLRLALTLAELYESEGSGRVDRDALTAAVLWHDWAKALVLTWRPDGTLPTERPIAGAGAHHVLGLAEAMARRLPPAVILVQACAHAAPVSEDGRKVGDWLRAAAIIARTDWTGPVAPTRECLINNAADDNWVHAEAAVHAADAALARLAPRFGHASPEGTAYRTRLRNPALEILGADRIKTLWEDGGDAAVEQALRATGF